MRPYKASLFFHGLVCLSMLAWMVASQSAPDYPSAIYYFELPPIQDEKLLDNIPLKTRGKITTNLRTVPEITSVEAGLGNSNWHGLPDPSTSQPSLHRPGSVPVFVQAAYTPGELPLLSYRYLWLKILNVRGGPEHEKQMVQIAEWKVYDEDNQLISLNVHVDCPGDHPWREGPKELVDGDADTKWLKYEFNQEASCIMDLTTPLHVRQSELITANDHPARDPGRYLVGGSNDLDGAWDLLLDSHGLPASRGASSSRLVLKKLPVVPPNGVSPSKGYAGEEVEGILAGGESNAKIKFVTNNCTMSTTEVSLKGIAGSPSFKHTFEHAGDYKLCYRCHDCDAYSEFGNRLKIRPAPKAKIDIKII